MNDEITVFMEYKIKAEFVSVYQTLIKTIKKKLESMGAAEFHSYKAADQDFLYVEYFKVKNISMYNTVKQARTMENEPFFHELHQLVEGGAQKIHCWAFIKQEVEDAD